MLERQFFLSRAPVRPLFRAGVSKFLCPRGALPLPCPLCWLAKNSAKVKNFFKNFWFFFSIYNAQLSRITLKSSIALPTIKKNISVEIMSISGWIMSISGWIMSISVGIMNISGWIMSISGWIMSISVEIMSISVEIMNIKIPVSVGGD